MALAPGCVLSTKGPPLEDGPTESIEFVGVNYQAIRLITDGARWLVDTFLQMTDSYHHNMYRCHPGLRETRWPEH